MTPDKTKGKFYKKVRKVLVMRNTLMALAKSKHPLNKCADEQLNDLSVVILNEAKKVNPKLPYYLAIGAV
jgi:hypothetical protein